MVHQLSYDAEFSPESCNTTYNAMTIGVRSSFVDNDFARLTTGEIPKAGVAFHTVYEFAETNNLTFIGGYHQTIAASGGWVQVHIHLYFLFPFHNLIIGAGWWPQYPLPSLWPGRRPRAAIQSRHSRRRASCR